MFSYFADATVNQSSGEIVKNGIMKSFQESVVLQFQRSCRAGQMGRSSLCCQSLFGVAVLFIIIAHWISCTNTYISSSPCCQISWLGAVSTPKCIFRCSEVTAAAQMSCIFAFEFQSLFSRFSISFYVVLSSAAPEVFSSPFSVVLLYSLCKIKNNNKCGWTAIYLDTQCTPRCPPPMDSRSEYLLGSVCALLSLFISFVNSVLRFFFYFFFPSIFHCWIRVQVRASGRNAERIKCTRTKPPNMETCAKTVANILTYWLMAKRETAEFHLTAVSAYFRCRRCSWPRFAHIPITADLIFDIAISTQFICCRLVTSCLSSSLFFAFALVRSHCTFRLYSLVFIQLIFFVVRLSTVWISRLFFMNRNESEEKINVTHFTCNFTQWTHF